MMLIECTSVSLDVRVCVFECTCVCHWMYVRASLNVRVCVIECPCVCHRMYACVCAQRPMTLLEISRSLGAVYNRLGYRTPTKRLPRFVYK
jgi:hypothetical protein